MEANERRYYTVRQFADRLQVGVHTVLSLIHSGRVRAVNVSTGKRPTWRIPLDAVLAFDAAAGSSRPVEKPRRRSRQTAGVIEFF